jgi:hypothetical protein
MYNLIVSARSGVWDQPHYTLPAGRYLEHTDDALKKRFENLTPEVIRELMRFPTVFAYELGDESPARVGKLTSIRERQGEIRVTFEMDKSTELFRSFDLDNHLWEFDINKNEMHRTHWAIKDVDLFGALVEAGIRTATPEAPPPQISRKAVILSTTLLRGLSHAEFDGMLLEFGVLGLKADRTIGGLQARANALAEFAVQNPSIQTAEGEALSLAIVNRAGEIAQRYPESETSKALTIALEDSGLRLDENGKVTTNRSKVVRIRSDVRVLSSSDPPQKPPGQADSSLGFQYPEAGLIIRPTVFRVPNTPIDASLVAVMMPFESSFDKVFEAINKGCELAKLRCQRVDSLWEDSVVMQDVFSLIYRSRIVIVDFSTRNPNVFYETGIAHTLGKSVVPLAQTEQDVPFDLRHHRYLKYLKNGEGLASLAEKLGERLTTLARDKQ